MFVHLPSSTKPESVGSILALNHKLFNASKSTGETKGSPFGFCFGIMRLLSKIFEIFGTPLFFLWSFRFVENVEWASMTSF